MYATHLPLIPKVPSPVPPEEGAKQVIASWCLERLGIAIDNWAAGSGTSGARSARWGTQAGEAGRLSWLVASMPDESSPWLWKIQLWVGRDAKDGAWIRVRIALDPIAEGVVIDPQASVGAPRFLHSLVTSYRMTADGRDIEDVWTVTPRDAGAYVDMLESPSRRLPIITLTRPSGTHLSLSAQTLARRLSGIANVVVVEPAATYEVSDLITPVRSVFGGAARVYWPGFNRRAHPYRHPLFMHPGQRGGIETFMDEVAGHLGRAAGSAFGPPSLEMALRREHVARAQQEARARREAQEAAARSESGGLSVEEFKVFSEELSSLEEAKAGADERILELELELDAEREANAAQRRAWASLATSGASVPESVNEQMPAPVTVFEAVMRAQECCPNLVFTQSAFESAGESQYEDPEQVLADLQVLEEVAALWASGEMRGDFRTEFDSRPVTFQSGVSQTARTMYESDYTITYKGEKVLIAPHLRRGVGAPPTILRIYWYKDDDGRKLVVGHVGRKLRDESNRN